MATLSDAERRAIELAYFGGHTYREVARDPGSAGRDHQEPDTHRADTAACAARRPGNRRIMDRELTPEEIAELLPAYALDAVDDDERARDRRVPRAATRRRARRGDASLQVAASMLAHAGGPPPDGVWEKLESIITESSRRRSRLRAPDVLSPRRAPRPRARVEPAVAVVRGGRRGGRTRLRRAVAGRAVRRRFGASPTPRRLPAPPRPRRVPARACSPTPTATRSPPRS